MSKEWEMFLNIGRDMEKNSNVRSSKGRRSEGPKKRTSEWGEKGGEDQKQEKWTTIYGKRKSSKS